MTETLDGPRGANQAYTRQQEEDVARALAAHLGEGHALRHEAGALAALMAGIAAAPDPEGADETWMDLIVPPPRAPALAAALREARAALTPTPPDTGHAETDARLRLLRRIMDEQRLSAFLIPRADAHQGEMVAMNAERLFWLTGFSGSAGSAIVTAERAALFVDGRYTLQAANQVNTAVWDVVPTTRTSPNDWLAEVLRRDDVLGYDPWLHTVGEVDNHESLCRRLGVRQAPVANNPIDALWRNRPPAPLGPVVMHPPELTGQPSAEKRARIAALVREQGARATVLGDPAALAWLLNIRGADVPNTPLALGFAILRAEDRGDGGVTGRVEVFMDPRKLTPAVRRHLEAEEARVRPPDRLGRALDDLADPDSPVLLNRETCPQWIRARLKAAGGAIRFGPDPVALPKARKTPAELAGARAAHVRDGAALTRFLCWLDAEGPAGTQTEASAARTLHGLRAEDPKFRGPSFETISGAGPNGAIVHYHVTPETDRPIEPDMLYLCDSGGQYRDGTTDVTRTVAIGTPTDEQRRRFTLVLKGHIAIAAVVFPPDTTGSHIDALARLALWRDGLDYQHGTGHGVGSFLGVHEGPQRISRRPSEVCLAPGMIVSNEPGYYKPGAYGIRIENLVVVATREAAENAEQPVLGFETLTLAPIDRHLIDAALLTEAERAWVDAYHARVRDRIGPLLDAPTRTWLNGATAPLPEGVAATS